MSDLIERLRNPAWIHSHVSVSATAALDEEQAVADMVEAAAEIARLQEAKRRALTLADGRAIEANGVRQENERLQRRVVALERMISEEMDAWETSDEVNQMLIETAHDAHKRRAAEQTARKDEG